MAMSIPTQTVSGTDVVLTSNIGKDQKAGYPLLLRLLGPNTMQGTRLGALSANWSRWRPVRLALEVVGGGSAMTYGSLVFGWAPDNHWQFNKNQEDYARIAALRPSLTMRTYETKTMRIPCEASRRWYTCTGQPDDANHGAVMGCVASTTGGYTASIGLCVVLHWTVQFEGAEFVSATGAVQDEIKPDNGWEHLFTTSDSGWDSERLTFKMKSGGSMVPFSSAKEHYVYTPGPNVRVPYKKEDGNDGDCKFFVVIQGYATPGLALCATKQDAIAYVKSGDNAKLIKYKGAGNYTTPDVPTFVGRPAATLEQELRVAAELLRDFEQIELADKVLRELESPGKDFP